MVSVAAAILLSAQTMLYRRVPLEKPPEALAERARDILQSVGYSEPPADTAMSTASRNYRVSRCTRWRPTHSR